MNTNTPRINEDGFVKRSSSYSVVVNVAIAVVFLIIGYILNDVIKDFGRSAFEEGGMHDVRIESLEETKGNGVVETETVEADLEKFTFSDGSSVFWPKDSFTNCGNEDILALFKESCPVGPTDALSAIRAYNYRGKDLDSAFENFTYDSKSVVGSDKHCNKRIETIRYENHLAQPRQYSVTTDFVTYASFTDAIENITRLQLFGQDPEDSRVYNEMIDSFVRPSLCYGSG